MGDSGLSGRKIIVDTYGGMARHGAAASAARTRRRSIDPAPTWPATWPRTWSPLAWQRELRLAYAIGVAHPLSINLQTFGTGVVDDGVLVDLVERTFDLRPGAIIADWTCDGRSTA